MPSLPVQVAGGVTGTATQWVQGRKNDGVFAWSAPQ
eukprot:CAMPEP_0206610768 /NCGR_PEP_ID=MMETSP0325_2-20121206/54777_1 /ASSEMBLY_ACC=CAM_ASM_000347 /TAXON_ID=2866 /ORGANISM="Crypthecodinium cohnii, Strain Seligo" /LENGTH=35 /DNA_ID= /DNA_START= /DNA_END= /DNA_ORIENTATION=